MDTTKIEEILVVFVFVHSLGQTENIMKNYIK